MKKLLIGLLVAVLLVSVLATTVFAAGQGKNFIDANGDGVCDNRADGTCGGKNGFVDADNDGVCDNFDPENRPHCGRGNGARRGCGR